MSLFIEIWNKFDEIMTEDLVKDEFENIIELLTMAHDDDPSCVDIFNSMYEEHFNNKENPARHADEKIAEYENTLDEINEIEIKLENEDLANPENEKQKVELEQLLADLNDNCVDPTNNIYSEIAEYENTLENEELTNPELEQRFESVKLNMNPKHLTPTVSSFAKGVIGENYIIEMLNKVCPDGEISKVSGTGHVGDIHVKLNEKLFVLEVKFKDRISTEDVNKFKSDMGTFDSNTVGIFMSLISQNIPTVGSIGIENNILYIGKDYVTKECLELIFKYLSGIQINSRKCENVKYEFDPNTLSLIMALKTEYSLMDHSKKLLDESIELNGESIKKLKELQYDFELKFSLVHKILIYIGEETSDTNTVLMNNEITRLRNFVNSTPKSRLTKKLLLGEFPLLKTEISNKKLPEIIAAYKNQ